MTRVNRRCKQRATTPQRQTCAANRTRTPARKPRPTNQAATGIGSVVGVVLRSARRSARASQATLAAACGVTTNTIGAWEDGSSPLTSVPMPQMEALIAALHQAGACRLLTADVAVAAWCDLIITAVAASEDVTSLLADPTTTEESFSQLMAWCVKGRVPRRYRPYVGGQAIFRESALIEQIRQAIQ
jgi:DNA-binding XRE family transcriptional regulator